MKSKVLMMGFAVMMTLAAHAQDPAATAPPAPAQFAVPPAYGAPITLAQARAVIARAEEEARKRKVVLSFAVVEPNGRLVAFSKMDGANYSSIESATKKAVSAALWRTSTSVFAALAKTNIIVLQMPDAYGSLGGEPLVIDGKVVGGLGISGSPLEAEIAKLAAEAAK